MDKFTSADTDTLLSQPGYFYERAYKSVGAWKKAVFANGANYAPSVEVAEIAFDDVGNVRDEVSNETVEISIASGRVLDFDFIYDLTGGLYEKEAVAGTPVAGEAQTIDSGVWVYDEVLLLENQNGDGSKPAVNSVTGSVDGLLVEVDDYAIVQIPGGWGIALNDSVTVTTEVQDIVVNYDYTPNAQTILKRGGVKIIDPIELAFQTVDENGNFVQFFFYKAFTNGADGHGFSPENTAEPITMDFVFTAKKDTNRAVGDQLMRKVIGDVSLG
jgi:hypothetical protein